MNQNNFFVAGGTLQPDAPSYIERQADRELFERVLAGDFCYVLTPRQMGKSSLMAHTAKRLQEQGVRTAIVDLTRSGTEKERQSADKWYYGIAHRILRELGLDVKLNEWWQERQNLPALQRFTEFFSDLVLADTTERVVIFVDEIDSTISLPFTDDFFAACADDAEIDRLVDQHFLAPEAHRAEHNLNFVRDRLIKDRQRSRLLLKLYRRIGLGQTVIDNPLSPAHAALKLSGLVTTREDRRLSVRNLIYERVFTPEWAKRVMPVDWNRRVAIASSLMFLLAIAAWYLVLQPQFYIREIERASEDVPNAPYQNLRHLPFYQEKADELMAQYWERHALRAENQEERDEGLLYRLRAATFHATVTRQQEAGRLAAKDYQSLLVTYRHNGAIFAVAFSPDGHKVVTSSSDGTARLWSTQNGTPLGEPMRHNDFVYAVAFSPDGQKVVTGSADHMARLWSAQNGAPLGEPMRHQNSVLAVAFSPDGQKVATGSDDRTARLWSAQNGAPLGEPMRHEKRVRAVAFSPDGQKVVTGSDDGTARLWSAENGAPLGEPMRHQNPVLAVAFSPDGQKMVTGSADDTARLWSAQNGTPLSEPMRHQSYVVTVAFSPDGQKVVTGSADGTARSWSAQNGIPLGEPMRHNNDVRAVAFSPNGQKVVTGSNDRTARIWSARNGTPLGEPLRHESLVYAVAFSPDGQKVVTGSSDRTAQLWSTQNGALLGEPMQHQNSVWAVAFSPDGQKVVTGSSDSTARLWSAQNGTPLGEPMRHQSSVEAVAFNPDGQKVVTGSLDGTARLWSAQNGALLGEPMRHQGSVYAVAFSPDGQKVVTGSLDGTARLWSAQNGAPLGEPMQHENRVGVVAFSPDGKTILAATKGWVHLSSVMSGTSTPVPKVSRLLAGSWTGAYHFLDSAWSQMQVAVQVADNAIKIDTLRFDIPNAPPLEGDPKKLLEEWQRKLALQFDENGKIVPMYPVEAARER